MLGIFSPERLVLGLRAPYDITDTHTLAAWLDIYHVRAPDLP